MFSFTLNLERCVENDLQAWRWWGASGELENPSSGLTNLFNQNDMCDLLPHSTTICGLDFFVPPRKDPHLLESASSCLFSSTELALESSHLQETLTDLAILCVWCFWRHGTVEAKILAKATLEEKNKIQHSSENLKDHPCHHSIIGADLTFLQGDIKAIVLSTNERLSLESPFQKWI